MFECDLSHRRSVAVLCMLYKIRCNPMHPLYDSLPLPYVPVRVIAHRYTYASPRSRTSQYHRTFIPLSVSLCDNLSVHVFDCVGLAGFKSQGQCPFIGLLLLAPFLSPAVFPFSFSFYGLVLWGCGLRTNSVLITLYQSCVANHF